MRRTSVLLVVCLALLVASSTVALAASAAIFDARDWQTNYLNYDDAVMVRCFAAKDTWGIYGTEGANISVLLESDLDNDPTITLQTWRNYIPGSSDADITSHGGDSGSLSAEHFEDASYRTGKFVTYTSGGYDTSQILSGTIYSGQDTAYVIAWKPQGIQDFLVGMPANAILYADFCHSCESASSWGLDLEEPWLGETGGSMFCYTASQPDQPSTDYRENIYGAMSALGCFLHPWRGPTVGDAEDEVAFDMDITVLGDRENSYHTNEDCHNVAAAFDGVFAFDGKVIFRTVNETGSFCFFVMGLDSWGDSRAADWRSWDVLARVRPEGGRGVAHLYEVDGVPAKAVYRIVEVDRYGRPTFSRTFARGHRPFDYDGWLEHPAIASDTREMRWTATGPRQWTSGRSVRPRRARGVPLEIWEAGSQDDESAVGARVDSSGCADIVVYTNTDWDSLLPPVEDHLANYPSRKVLYFTGSSSLDDARTCYGNVCQANALYNGQSGTDRYPTDAPGPLLLIVGDSGMSSGRTVVLHETFDDTYDRCARGACYSDRDATDLGSGWCGPVHRIPGATVAEVTTACEGADDWNDGDFVDPGRHVIRIVGDELGGVAVDWPVEMAEAAAAKFFEQGYASKPVLVESDFGVESKVAAFNAQVETGAAVLWGFGRLTGNLGYNYWPGHFVGYPDTTVHTVKQRMIALLPGCETIAPWIGYTSLSAPRIERWMFREPERTQIVGGVGHLLGAWEHQHRKAEELYMEAWSEAPVGAPLDWVVWRAAQMAEDQGLDWMEDYFRTAATVGAYVLARPRIDWTSSIMLTESDSLMFCPAGDADSVTAVVTARDLDTGEPIVGLPAENIRVYGFTSDPSYTFTYPCAEDSFASYPYLNPTGPTDSNGQAFVPLHEIGGYDTLGYVTAAIDYQGATTFRGAPMEVKSPDYDGDGDVDPIDLNAFAADYGQGVGWRSDFDHDGDVDPVDLSRFSGHFGHGCGNKRTMRVPPELLARLGLISEDEAASDLPKSFALGQSRPNPSNPIAVISYAVPDPGGRVTIDVFDVAGRRVTTLVDAEIDPGWYAVTWDGTDDTGRKVASGVYFYRMDAAGFSDRRKLTILK